MDLRKIAMEQFGYEDERPGAQGSDIGQADESWRSMVAHHHDLVRRLQAQAQQRRN